MTLINKEFLRLIHNEMVLTYHPSDEKPSDEQIKSYVIDYLFENNKFFKDCLLELLKDLTLEKIDECIEVADIEEIELRKNFKRYLLVLARSYQIYMFRETSNKVDLCWNSSQEEIVLSGKALKHIINAHKMEKALNEFN